MWHRVGPLQRVLVTFFAEHALVRVQLRGREAQFQGLPVQNYASHVEQVGTKGLSVFGVSGLQGFEGLDIPKQKNASGSPNLLPKVKGVSSLGL